jgi:predicted dehydrogenase
MTQGALRIGVVGAGHMGRLHAQKLAALRRVGLGIELHGIVDVHPERAQSLAQETGSRAFSGHRRLYEEVDAVVIAAPTIHHFELVRAAFEAGLDVLVEKPIVATLADAQTLLDMAKSAGRILQVGHVERYNSALRRVETLIKKPRFIEAHRIGPFPARATDVDVVRDLMIHDLGIVQDLLGEEPVRLEAIGIPVLSREVDIANARLHFPGGCVANLTASRVSPTTMRRLRLFQRDAYFSIDFLAQSVAVFRRFDEPGAPSPRVEMERLEIDHADALESEQRAFVESLRSRRPPLVSGEEAVRALRSAVRVMDAMPPLDDLS